MLKVTIIVFPPAYHCKHCNQLINQSQSHLLDVGHAACDELPDEVGEGLLVLLRDVDGALVDLGEDGRVDVDLLLGEHGRHGRRRHRRVARPDLVELLQLLLLGELRLPLLDQVHHLLRVLLHQRGRRGPAEGRGGN